MKGTRSSRIHFGWKKQYLVTLVYTKRVVASSTINTYGGESDQLAAKLGG